MHLFTITNREGMSVRIERDVNTNKVTVDKIAFIKLMRAVMHGELRESKECADKFIESLNGIMATPEAIRSEIVADLHNINEPNDLFDIMRFVRTVIDHPKPFEQPKKKTNLGAFDEEGNYIPTDQLRKF
jgi:hypothetical protein